MNRDADNAAMLTEMLMLDDGVEGGVVMLLQGCVGDGNANGYGNNDPKIC